MDRHRRRTLASLLALLASGSARAANFCVDTSIELQQALTTAGSNGQSDVIRIESGTYLGQGGNVAFAFVTSENFDLTISGGWSTAPPNLQCFHQASQPFATVLAGSNQRQVLRMSGVGGDISVSNLTIRDGFSSQSGAGASIGGGGFSGDVTVTRTSIERNVSTGFGGGLSVSAEGGVVRIINNQFLFNECGSGNCAISATINAPDGIAIRAYFGNNSIVGNQCTAGGSGCTPGGARFGGSARAVFYNNAFAANSAGDLRLQVFGAGNVQLYNNNVIGIDGSAPTVQSQNLAFVNPLFVNLLDDDLRLTFESPLRNAGTLAFEVATTDLAGNPRINEAQIDIGAYENDNVLLRDGFEFEP